MATRYTGEFRRDAVRIAITSGLARPKAASDSGGGLSALNKWVQKHRHDDLMSGPHADVAKENEHLDQTDESDVNFLSRIAKDHDAIASVKGGALLFIGKGEGKSGELRWSMTLASRGNFKAVEAHCRNEGTGQKETETAGEGSPVKRLRHVHSTKTGASSAAKAKLDEVRRGDDTLSISMPGDPTVAAEGRIIASGFRIGVSGQWSVTGPRHQISGGRFTTSIETEKPKV